MRQLRGGDDFLVGSVLAADADVFQYRVIEQRDILEHNGIQAHQGFRINLGNVHAAHRDGTGRNVPETGCQAGDGRLSGTGRADERRHLALTGRKGNAVQDGLRSVVCETDILEFDVIALIGETLRPPLLVMAQDFVHPLALDAQRDGRTQVDQRSRHGIVKTGGHQQEHEEGKHIKRPCR